MVRLHVTVIISKRRTRLLAQRLSYNRAYLLVSPSRSKTSRFPQLTTALYSTIACQVRVRWVVQVPALRWVTLSGR